MSIKLIKDTFQLSEFGSQRFLYGNLIPAFLTLFLSLSFILWEMPITSDLLPLLGLITLLSMVFAYITNRLSRSFIYFACSLKTRYKEYLLESEIVDITVKNYLKIKMLIWKREYKMDF